MVLSKEGRKKIRMCRLYAQFKLRGPVDGGESRAALEWILFRPRTEPKLD